MSKPELHRIAYFGKPISPMTPDQIKDRLQEAYPQSMIEVVDLTGTNDHYEVSVTSSAFAGLSRVQQHQHVMGVFAPELKTGEVHALSIKTKLKE